jgi:hypothetical protein
MYVPLIKSKIFVTIITYFLTAELKHCPFYIPRAQVSFGKLYLLTSFFSIDAAEGENETGFEG